MIYWKLFVAFFIPGIVGYGGGPASIPLIQNEVVNRYHWMTLEQFGEILALGNALPGPIATKMAGYIGYEVGGFLGAIVALFATVGPSLLAMILFLSLLYRYRNSPKIQKMTAMIRPVVGILLAVIAFQFFQSSWEDIGILQTVVLILVSLLLLEKWKVHPAWVISGSLVYGVLFLA
ncbi:putative transporter YwrA [Marinithermofilum abyssi]|uniref:Putative transporter YwrA n=1 Tax=Marinithermofilum abyssi TaxID=1571185 RepID=A0A8J2VEU6_9BACL|nr:chromate transporter [Marinithermofilum abyssi]GGE12646.1 putative transporter YwrA [Marinithermofilum abyssi]